MEPVTSHSSSFLPDHHLLYFKPGSSTIRVQATMDSIFANGFFSQIFENWEVRGESHPQTQRCIKPASTTTPLFLMPTLVPAAQLEWCLGKSLGWGSGGHLKAGIDQKAFNLSRAASAQLLKSGSEGATVITLAMSCLQLFECSQTAVCWFCLYNISGKGAKNEKVGLSGTPPTVPGLRINQ